jgi:hypothetical protein
MDGRMLLNLAGRCRHATALLSTLCLFVVG